MNFLSLHPLTSDDLPEAVALDQRCLGGLWTENGYQREIDSLNSDLLALRVKSSTDSLDSFCCTDPLIATACTWAILDEAHITLLAVDPAYRQQGFGQLLLYALLALARRRGLEWATLEVRLSNQAAIALYQKFGFESVGQRRRYYDDGEDALILWRKGLQQPEFKEVLWDWQQRLSQRFNQTGWHLSTFPDIGWNPDNLIKFAASS